MGTAEVGEKEAGNGIWLRKWASLRRLGFRGRKGWNCAELSDSEEALLSRLCLDSRELNWLTITALFSSNCKLFKSCCFGSLGPKGRNWLDVTVVDWEEGGTAVARLGMEGKKESCIVEDSAGL